ncbi:endonuclease domain-containing protein [bacterium]|nr:endonuclease domain-containing protein [bacterium]
MTDAEQSLWYYLRGKRFLGYKFKRQVPIGKYIVDFLCTDTKTIIELDGSGHLKPAQIQHDNERETYLKEKGYKVIRVLNTELKNMESVLEYIKINIENPSP